MCQLKAPQFTNPPTAVLVCGVTVGLICGLPKGHFHAAPIIRCQSELGAVASPELFVDPLGWQVRTVSVLA